MLLKNLHFQRLFPRKIFDSSCDRGAGPSKRWSLLSGLNGFSPDPSLRPVFVLWTWLSIRRKFFFITISCSNKMSSWLEPSYTCGMGCICADCEQWRALQKTTARLKGVILNVGGPKDKNSVHLLFIEKFQLKYSRLKPNPNFLNQNSISRIDN